MNIFSWKCLAVAALALVASGCGGGGPAVYKAGGTVTNNKVPVEGAQVTFAYDDGDFANGFTDATGKFELTFKNNPGRAKPGICKVSISKRAGATTGGPASDILTRPVKSKEEQQAKMAAQQKQMEEFARQQANLDAAGGGSGDITKSGLVREIKTNELENNFAIDLNDFKN